MCGWVHREVRESHEEGREAGAQATRRQGEEHQGQGRIRCVYWCLYVVCRLVHDTSPAELTHAIPHAQMSRSMNKNPGSVRSSTMRDSRAGSCCLLLFPCSHSDQCLYCHHLLLFDPLCFRRRWFMPKPLRFRGVHALKVQRIGEPSNVKWENLDTSWTEQMMRRAVAFLIMLAMLILSIAVVFWVTLSKNKASERCVGGQSNRPGERCCGDSRTPALPGSRTLLCAPLSCRLRLGSRIRILKTPPSCETVRRMLRVAAVGSRCTSRIRLFTRSRPAMPTPVGRRVWIQRTCNSATHSTTQPLR